MVNSEILKEVVLEKLRGNPNSKATDIQQYLKLNYGLDVAYHMAWYGKKLARETVLGVEADSYRELKWFGMRTSEANPQSRIDIQCANVVEVPSPKIRFTRMFVVYHASMNGFQCCRPVLHVDATFITNKYRVMLLAATVKDANNGLYHAAYAIVDSETEDNWLYFFTHIPEFLSRFPQGQVTFISDRNIGLLKAVRQVFPNSPLSFYYRHLQSNLGNKFSSSSYLSKRIPFLFMRCAYARTRENFEISLEKLKREGGVA